jgi:putative ABC transport system permease protein
VLDETSYDKHWENADRIYRVNTSSWSAGGGFVLGAGTAMPVMPALQNFFPQAIETGTRFMSADSEITIGNQRFEETVRRVDRGFLDMFELEPLAGSLAEALSDPTRVALNADFAERFFGARENLAGIIGQVLTISYNGVTRDYQVAAVYRFPAGNTVLDLPMLTLLDTSVFPPFFNSWTARTGQSYVQLQPGADAATVNADLRRFSDQNADIS